MKNQTENTPDGYSSLSVSLHWVMLALIFAAYALMNLKGMFPSGSHEREMMANWHYTFGLSVLILVCVRIWARIAGPTPEVKPPIPGWQIDISNFMHTALYMLMIFLPVLGWLAVCAKGTVISFYGLELPSLVNENKEFFTLFKRIHERFATVGYFLIGLHAAAALFHHYFKRDKTMNLMVPWLRRRTGR